MSYLLWQRNCAGRDSSEDDDEGLKHPGPDTALAELKPPPKHQEKKKQRHGLALAPPISPMDRPSTREDGDVEVSARHHVQKKQHGSLQASSDLPPAKLPSQEEEDAVLDDLEASLEDKHEKKQHGLAMAPPTAPPRRLSFSEDESRFVEEDTPSIITYSGVPGAFSEGGGFNNDNNGDNLVTEQHLESLSVSHQDLPMLTAQRVTEPEIAEIVPPGWWSFRRNRFVVVGVAVLIIVGVVCTALVLVLPRQTSSSSTSISGDQWKLVGNEILGGSSGDHAGYSVSLSSNGTIVAIGAPFADSTGINAGQAAVYELLGGSWTQLGQNLTGVRAGDWFGLSVALSSDGRTLAVGASENDDGGTNSGAVYVYRFDGAMWMQLGNDILGESPRDRCGKSVSITDDGHRVAIGSIFAEGPGGPFAGHVRVFDRDDQTWRQIGSTIEGVGEGDQFGFSVSLSSRGNVVAVGALNNDDWDVDAGHVRVFRFEDQDWIKLGSTIEGEVQGDKSGISVSLSSNGEVVAIGALHNGGNGVDSGQARVFLFADDWTQIGSDLDGKAPGDLAGRAVALSGDGLVVAVGAPQNEDANNATTESGLVQVYKLTGSEWIPLGNDINGQEIGEETGYSVALSFDGTVVAVGARWNDANGDDAGVVRVFRLEQE